MHEYFNRLLNIVKNVQTIYTRQLASFFLNLLFCNFLDLFSWSYFDVQVQLNDSFSDYLKARILEFS